MSVASVGTRGWEAKPWQSKVSVSVQSARLTVARLLDLAMVAAREVQDDQGWVTVRERTSSSVDLRIRDLVRSDGDEVMQFHVEAAFAAGRATARSVIDVFRTKDSRLAGFVAVANRKVLGYSAYNRYIEGFGWLAVAEDPAATVSFTGGK